MAADRVRLVNVSTNNDTAAPWSAWGYTSDGMTALYNGVSPGDAIVLWAHPGQGTSWKLDTREFSVGKALDRRAFAIPEHTTNGTSP